jgi:hypothetical protein
MSNMLLAKKITYNPHMVPKHRIGYKLFNKCVIQHHEINSLASYEISHDSQETMVFENHSNYI